MKYVRHVLRVFRRSDDAYQAGCGVWIFGGVEAAVRGLAARDTLEAHRRRMGAVQGEFS